MAYLGEYPIFASQNLFDLWSLGYPPYAALVLYRCEAETPQKAFAPLKQLKERLAGLSGLRLLGPIEAPVARVKDKYRMQLIMKAATRSGIGEALRRAPLDPAGPLNLDRDPVELGA